MTAPSSSWTLGRPPPTDSAPPTAVLTPRISRFWVPSGRGFSSVWQPCAHLPALLWTDHILPQPQGPFCCVSPTALPHVPTRPVQPHLFPCHPSSGSSLWVWRSSSSGHGSWLETSARVMPLPGHASVSMLFASDQVLLVSMTCCEKPHNW